jgi:hypothetical protein
VDKIRRDIPEFDPKITLEDGIPACIAWMEEHGMVGDALTDTTEDRIIAAIDQLWRTLEVEGP